MYLEYGTKSIPIYKPYRDEFVVDKGKSITDTVQDITILKIPNDSNNLIQVVDSLGVECADTVIEAILSEFSTK